MTKQIIVFAAETQEDLEKYGAVVVFDFDTVKEAKERAKYYLTDEYRVASEASTRLGYAQVLVDGEVRYDFFAR